MRLAPVLALCLVTACVPLCSVRERAVVPTPMTVLIQSTCSDGIGIGMGIPIGPDRVLSAGHVVRCHDGSDPEMIVVGDETYGVTSRAKDADLAIITAEVNRPFALWAIPVLDKPRLGAEVCSWKSIGVSPLVFWCGRASGTDDDGHLIVAMRVRPGNSGSPIYDADGNLIGVLVAYSPGNEDIGYVELLSRAPELLERR